MGTKLIKNISVFLLVFSLLGSAMFWPREDVQGSKDNSEVDFSQYSAGENRKEAFFAYFLPIAKEENNKILSLRKKLKNIISGDIRSKKQKSWGTKIADAYKLKDFNAEKLADWQRLLIRVDVIPASLVLAQSANESAWGTSRFAKEGNNYFGQWCFKSGCGIVPGNRKEGATHEVAVFNSPRHSVERYMFNINSTGAYDSLRNIRNKLRVQGDSITGLKLAEGLGKYSARGDDYIKELQSMIRYNKLEKFDYLPTN